MFAKAGGETLKQAVLPEHLTFQFGQADLKRGWQSLEGPVKAVTMAKTNTAGVRILFNGVKIQMKSR